MYYSYRMGKELLIPLDNLDEYNYQDRRPILLRLMLFSHQSFRCNILPQVGFMDASIFQAFPSEYCHPDVHISGHGNSSHFVCWIQPLFSPTSEPPFENKPNIDTVFKYRVCIKFLPFSAQMQISNLPASFPMDCDTDMYFSH